MPVTERRNPNRTRMPRSERRNCASSKGMIRSRLNDPNPARRSLQLASAHSRPTAASAHSRTGKPPAAVNSSRRTAAASNVSRTTTSQTATRIPVAVVDRATETATATASQSATRDKAPASNVRARTVLVIVIGLRFPMVIAVQGRSEHEGPLPAAGESKVIEKPLYEVSVFPAHDAAPVVLG